MSMHSDRRKILIGLGAAALGSAALGARAQGSTPAPGRASVYSSGKLIRVLNGFPAGGSADVVSRLVADGIRARTGSSVIVENRPGGGGRTVLEQARTADPDGSVIVLSPIGMLTIFPHVYRNLGYDTFRDYTAAGCTSTFVTAITAGSTLPSRITTLHDLIEWGRSNPQGASYGSPGSGSSMHFVGTMISRLAGNTMTHVPYKGAAPMIQDLLGGQIPLGMVPIGDAVPYVRGGKLRVIATSGPQRSRFLPEVPTTAEAGYPEVVGEEFFALFVPARTPAATVAELNGIINEAVNTPAFQDRLVQMGLESRTASPEQMNAIVRSAYAAWAPIVKASGFTADD